MTAEQSARALDGQLRLTLSPGRDGRTQIATERTPPLHLQRLLYLDRRSPGLAYLQVLSGVAGLFRDDRLTIAVDVAAGAAAAIGTPTMTRVFAMPDGVAETSVTLRVARGGYLQYLTEPTLLCASAALRQRLQIEVADGSCLVAGELLAFGREAAGERHAYRCCEQRTELAVGGALVLTERLSLPGTAAAARTTSDPLRAFAAYGALYVVCGCEPASDLLNAVRAALCALPVYAGASLSDGERAITLRLLASSAWQLRGAAAQIARVVRDRHAARGGVAVCTPH